MVVETMKEDEPCSLNGDAKMESNLLKSHTKEDDRDYEPNILSKNEKEDELVISSPKRKEDDSSVRRTEDGGETEVQEDQASSTYEVLHHFSEEAVRVAGEALQSMYFSGPVSSPPLPTRRSQSDIGPARNKHSNSTSFQRLKTQLQRAWRGTSNTSEINGRPSFNPEVLANQKRQWYQLHSSKSMDHAKYIESTSLFEHLIILGLHPEADLAAVEKAFAKRKKWEMEKAKSDTVDDKSVEHGQSQLQILEPQILFQYPPGKKLAMRPKDLAAFCFPGGVQARLLERTPSLSDLNEVVYGQEHLGTDDSAFIFSRKVADCATLYGVCLHVSEIVQRPPGILGTSSPLRSSGRGSRFLVSAPRCYCLLTAVPFFELHFEMLNSIIAQERLNRITEFVNDMSLCTSNCVPVMSKIQDLGNGSLHSPVGEDLTDWMASAIPVDRAMALTAAAAGMIQDDETLLSSSKYLEPQSPESLTGSEASDVNHGGEVYRDRKKSSPSIEDNASEASESQYDGLERPGGSYESLQASPEVGAFVSSWSHPLERTGSSESLFSPARSNVSDDDDDGIRFSNSETDFGDELIMDWAKEHKNELLQIVCGYHSSAIPPRGSEIVFQPLDHLQAIVYRRPPLSALGFSQVYLDSCEPSEVKAKLAAAEEAMSLSIWTTATICRFLSLESLLALLAGVLLEKHVVIVCSNLGVLSATVLSVIPLIFPFQWQSLLLPVLPGRMLDFLEAPVPYIVGIQNKAADLKIKTSNLVQVNVLHDQVKTLHLPPLPRLKELKAQLSPIHAKLADEREIANRHPVYRCNEAQGTAATEYLSVIRHYMESLCSDLRSHAITSVQSNKDRVSLLLKDSFIDSFPRRDRPFVKLLVDTQLFSSLSDSRLSSFENGHL